MLSRRLFLLSSLTFLGAPGLYASALAARRKQAAPAKSGPRSIARQDWPPAIVPNHIAITGGGLVAVADEFGRLALIDFKRAEGPRVAGELSGLGKRLLDFVLAGQRAYALVLQDTASGETAYMLTTVSLAPASEPSVMWRLPLEQYSEPACLAAAQDIICVAGTALNGSNLVSVFRKGKSTDPSLVSTFTVEHPVVRMDLQDRQLVVLSGPRNSQIDYVNLYYPHAPQVRKTIKLNGDYPVMARFRDQLFVAGQPSGSLQFEAKAIALEPAPHAVNFTFLSGTGLISDAAVQRGRLLILCERGTERAVMSFLYDKTLDLTPEQTLVLPGGKDTPGLLSRLTVKDRSAYVASGWAGVEVLTLDKTTGWRHALTYAIPRMPASAVASWGDLVVLGGADLKLYNVAKPDKPVLVLTAEPGSTVKALAGAGSYILCLAHRALTLRRMTNPNEVVVSHAASGDYMAYDTRKQKAYILSASEKKSTVTPIKVYSNSFAPEKPLDFPGVFNRVAARDGYLVLRGLSDVALYRTEDTTGLVGKRHFDTLALRDAWLADDYLLATAVDRSSKGFLMVLSRQEPDLKSIGVLDLPHDGVAVAASGDKAVAVGRSPEGRDLVSVVSLASPTSPRIVTSLAVVEAASAVTFKDGLVIVVGRGLEILSLG